MRRYRPAISVALFVVVALLVPICALSVWAGNTVYDSDTFSRRAVEVLDNPVTRKELARRITEQLAKAGNQQAVNFRPAFQLAVEVAADTDTFRSIFRNAVFRTHEALLQGGGSGVGLDLSDSIGIITSTLQLPGDAKAGQTSATGGLGNTLNDVTTNLGKLRVWDWEDYVGAVTLVTFLLAVACTVAAIWVSFDRRRAVVRLGIALVASGVLILLFRLGGQLAAERAIRDADLAKAVGAAIDSATDDLKIVGFWLIGYGIVVAAASSVIRQTPRVVGQRILAWAQRRRATTKGRIFLGALLLLAGIIVPQDPWFWAQGVVYVAGLWLVYLGVYELMSFVRVRDPAAAVEGGVGSERRRMVVAGAVVVALLAVTTGGFIFLTRRAASRAAAAGVLRCNGAVDLCNVPLNDAVFPGSHNSMSSALYPGWLFAEQISTIKGQFDAGVRAFLIDTHYGEQSTVKMPGPDVPLVVTDRAAELAQPPGKENDPLIEARAQALAARATPAAHAQRAIYLCHNTCETGAVLFSTVLGDVKAFLQSHPDDVVMLIIQDATTPADTAGEIERAGLGDKAATLVKGQPLPTLRELINADKRLLVFAEQGGPGAPSWYMPAYEDWFQETDYAFPSLEGFNCKPNRGKPDNPLFLVNHWVRASPPDPSKAAQANSRDALERRLLTCLKERGLVPNVLAVDFAEKGDLVAYTRDLGDDLRQLSGALSAVSSLAGADTTASASTTSTTTPTTTLPPVPTTTPPTTAPRPSVVITDLSGGDPQRFCQAYTPGIGAMVAWATAAISSPPGHQGLVDLAYAAVLDRDFGALMQAAPTKLAAQAAPFSERVARAMVELRTLGLDEQRIARLAEETSERIASPDSPDGATIELGIVSELNEAVGAAAVNAAADRLTQAGGGADALIELDLGTIPPDVGNAAGYTCLTEVNLNGG